MNQLRGALSKSIAVLFGICFLWVTALFFLKGKSYIDLNGLAVLLGGLLVILFCFSLFYLSSQMAPQKPRLTESLILFLLFGAYLTVQLLVSVELRTTLDQSWDFGVVAQAAVQKTLYDLPPTSYFNQFPNNIPLFFLLVGLFKTSAALGCYNFVNVGIGFNIVMIDLAIVVAYLTVRKLTRRRSAALVAAVLLMLTLPLLNYVAIYYTDTLTLLFPILTLYLWICAKENIYNDRKIRACIQTSLAALSAAAGALLKISVAIVLIALVIDALLALKIKKTALLAGIACAVFFAAYLPSNHAMRTSSLLPEAQPGDYIPWTHWIMMGLRGDGNYYDPDYQLTLSFAPEQRDELVKEEIASRVQDYGFWGLLRHQSEKSAFVWGDGDYYTHIKIMRDRANPSSLDKYIIFDGQRHAVYAYFCQFIQLAYILSFLIAAVHVFLNKDLGKKLLPFVLCVLGLFLFQNLWEARSRYLLNCLPVFAAIAACCYQDVYARLCAQSRSNRGNRHTNKGGCAA